ncbi:MULTISPECIES: DsbA family protein [unclassified Streptomyces]|uniref:DsbA family protein n=1 Tax=unclassified Streptomyces TaxID=2593676 RepID=UPI0006AEF2B4|nr:MULTISPECIES: DsbA family protein [unclassified Streptomyces]
MNATVRVSRHEGDAEAAVREELRVEQRVGEPALPCHEEATELASEAGLEYRLENAVPVNTFDVHRLIHFGEHRSLGEPVRERLLRGYTAEGAHLGDRRTLVRLGGEAGLDAAEVEALLDGDEFGDAVRADERRAVRLGITGVPGFSFDGRPGVSGALSVADIAGRLRRAAASAGT